MRAHRDGGPSRMGGCHPRRDSCSPRRASGSHSRREDSVECYAWRGPLRTWMVRSRWERHMEQRRSGIGRGGWRETGRRCGSDDNDGRPNASTYGHIACRRRPPPTSYTRQTCASISGTEYGIVNSTTAFRIPTLGMRPPEVGQRMQLDGADRLAVAGSLKERQNTVQSTSDPGHKSSGRGRVPSPPWRTTDARSRSRAARSPRRSLERDPRCLVLAVILEFSAWRGRTRNP